MRINRQVTVTISISMGLLLLMAVVLAYRSMNHLKNQEIAQLQKTLLDESKKQLRDVIQNAYSVLETANFYEPAQAAVASMRFGEKNRNSLFIVDQKGMFWVYPDQPELVGKVYPYLADINGKRYIEQIIANTQNTSQDGFIQYDVFKENSTKPSTKLMHYKLYPKWGWIVCAGIFIDDIQKIVDAKETQMRASMAHQMWFIVFGELLVSIFGIWICRRFFRRKLVEPLEELAWVAEEMVTGNFDREIQIESSLEINQLVDAMQRMQDSFNIAYERLGRKTVTAEALQAQSLRLIKKEPPPNKSYDFYTEAEQPALRTAS